MPQVPRRDLPETRLTGIPQAGGPGQVSAAAAGGGAPLERSLQAASGLNKEIQQKILEERRAADQLGVMEYDNALANRQLDMWNAAREVKGKEALNLEEEMMPEFQKFAEEQGKNLNPRQQAAAQARFNQRNLELRSRLTTHSFKEKGRYSNEVKAASVKTSQNEALDSTEFIELDEKGNITGDLATRRKIGEGIAHIADWAKREKVSDEKRDLEIAEYVSTTNTEAVKLLLETNKFQEAKAYAEAVEEDFVGEDPGTVQRMLDNHETRVLAKQKRQLAINRDRIEQESWMKALDRTISLAEARTLFDTGAISKDFHSALVKRITTTNDDPTISTLDKNNKYFEIMQRFADLEGADVDSEGNVIANPEGNTLQVMGEFRAFVADNAAYLTEKQERDLYKYTQSDWNASHSFKMSLLKRFWQGAQEFAGESATTAKESVKTIAGDPLTAADILTAPINADNPISKNIRDVSGVTALRAGSDLARSMALSLEILDPGVTEEQAQKKIQEQERKMRLHAPGTQIYSRPLGKPVTLDDGEQVTPVAYTADGKALMKKPAHLRTKRQ